MKGQKMGVDHNIHALGNNIMRMHDISTFKVT